MKQVISRWGEAADEPPFPRKPTAREYARPTRFRVYEMSSMLNDRVCRSVCGWFHDKSP
jgi:hypothetical protein